MTYCKLNANKNARKPFKMCRREREREQKAISISSSVFVFVFFSFYLIVYDCKI